MRFEHKFMSLIILHSIAFYLFVLAIVRTDRAIAFVGLFFFSVGIIIFSPFVPEIPEKNEKPPKLVIFGTFIYILVMILAFLGVSIMQNI